MTEQNNNLDDEMVRSAFERLQADAQKVDTMKAMREMKEGGGVTPAWLRPAVGLASVAVVIATGVLIYSLNSDGQKEVRSEVAGNPPVVEPNEVDDLSTTTIGGQSDNLKKESTDPDTSSSSLKPPASLEPGVIKEPVSPADSSFAEFACGEYVINDATAGEAIDHVFKVESFVSDTCRRSVFYFGKEGSTGAATGFIDELEEAGHDHTKYLRFDLPANWRTDIIELSGDYSDLSITSNENLAGAGFATVVNEENPYLYVDHGSVSTTTYTFLSNPARLVIDTQIDASSPPPDFGSGVYIQSLQDADDIGDCCASISGLATPFEGVGNVELQDSEGNPVKADWQGDALYGDSGSWSEVSSVGFMTSGPGWQEFSFEIDNISAGNYKFVFTSGAVSPQEDPSSVLEVPFTVVTDV